MHETAIDHATNVADVARRYSETVVVRGFSQVSRQRAARLREALQSAGIDCHVSVGAVLHRSHRPAARGHRLLVDVSDGDRLDAARLGAVLDADVLTPMSSHTPSSEPGLLGLRPIDHELALVEDVAMKGAVVTVGSATRPELGIVGHDSRHDVRLGSDARVILQPTSDGMTVRFDGVPTTYIAHRVHLFDGAAVSFDGSRPRALGQRVELRATTT